MNIELTEHNVPGLVVGIVFLIAVYTFSGIWIFTHEGAIVNNEGDPPTDNGTLWNTCAAVFWIFTFILAIAFIVMAILSVIGPFIFK